MVWFLLLVAALLGAFAAASTGKVLEKSAPSWSRRRRLFASTGALPFSIMVLTVVGVSWTLASEPGDKESFRDLAIAAVVWMGGLFAIGTLAGGLVGTALFQRRRS